MRALGLFGNQARTSHGIGTSGSLTPRSTEKPLTVPAFKAPP